MTDKKYTRDTLGYYKCITVKSVTYAQKAKKLLEEIGIDGYISRRERGDGRSCLWCVKVRTVYLDRALEILREGGVAMTGETYDA